MLVVHFSLNSDSVQELEQILSTHPQPYMRERASALLQVASGKYIKDVAAHGLLRKRDAHCVGDWVARYQAEGLSGLSIRSGRGRKAAFFPPQLSTSTRPTTGRGAAQSDDDGLSTESLAIIAPA